MTAARIDPDELLPSNPDGKAAGPPQFYDTVIAAINEHADEIETVSSLVVDAINYGASGSGSVDDTAALQRALDGAQGKVLYLRKGKYKVTSTLHIRSNSHRIVGDLAARADDGGTEIVYTGTGPLFEIGSDNGHAWDAADYDGYQDQWFENLWISHGAPDTPLAIGGDTGSYKAGAYAIRDWRGGSLRLKSVGIERFEYNFWGVQSDINEFDDVTSLYSRYGIYAGPRCDQFTLRNLYTFFCDQALVLDGQLEQFRLIDAQIVGCGTATLCPIEVRQGAAGIRIVRPWFEHLQGYAGSDGAGFVAAGLVAGYNNNTGSAKRITIDEPIVLTPGIGLANHVRCIAQLGKAYDVRIDRPASPVGYSDGLNLDAFVIAPSGTSYTNSQAFAEITGIDSGIPVSSLFLNEGSGTPGFSYIADVGSSGVRIYTQSGVSITGTLHATDDVSTDGDLSAGAASLESASITGAGGLSVDDHILQQNLQLGGNEFSNRAGSLNLQYSYNFGVDIGHGGGNTTVHQRLTADLLTVNGLATLAAGVVTKTKAGAPTDADFTNPVDGLIAIDTTNSKLYVRIGGTWKSVTLT